MRARLWWTWILVALIGATTCGTAAAKSQTPKPPPDLSGTWQLDPARSDDPREAMRPHMVTGGPGGFGGGGRPPMDGDGGGPTVVQGDPIGGPPPEGGAEPGAEPHERLPLPILEEQLEIRQAGDRIELRSQGRLGRVLIVDPAETVSTRSDDGADQAAATWKGKKLVTERAANGHHVVRETFELKDKGQSLNIKTRITIPNSPMGTIEFKRVYARKTGT